MIDFTRLLARDLPQPAGRFGGLPRWNFVGGNNDPALVPVEALAEAAARTIRAEGRKLALYNMGEGPMGHPALREFVAGKLESQRGIAGGPENVLITSGSLQGLDLVNEVLLEPGDTVLMEEHTYGGAITRVQRCGARVVGMPVDADGIRMDRLAEILGEMRSRGVRPKYLYTIPTIQNPTGSVMPVERRRELLRLSAEHGVPVFEDECYADLLWEGEWPPALRGMEGGEQVIHIGSFSKSLAPALRLGYVSAPWEITSRLLACKDDGGTPSIEQMIVADFFGRHFDGHVRHLKEGLRRKLDVLVAAVEEEFGTSAELSLPKGGIFLWITLPEEVDTSRLAEAALAEGVAINPGAQWSTDSDNARRSLRLCFALPPEEDLREGVARLAAVCHREFGVPLHGANKARRSA
ncbi:PLP-dependent aminotransferase family protein [Geminicoccaceae bacterium 1502E]|nr:PLP-dependent aminotransferase family protein [Geminicoccaceae bacterium 1502E]